jgi:hypothetical protein
MLDVQGAEGEKRSSPLHISEKKRKDKIRKDQR